MVISSEKMTLIFAFWQGFWGLDGIKYMAKYSSILRFYQSIGDV